ncbi:MAG: cupin domain-containing protein [Desulfobacterales bacterium]|nr:MAG: cupin domain-containing protein [Desulfobacterales bacterium]
MKNADYWIDKLDLQHHPEGGYFRETYRSNEVILKQALPERFKGDRVFSTCIYFLLNKNEHAAFHAIQQDEVWHFYEGSSLTIHIIDPKGEYSAVKMGRDLENGEYLQAVVRAGCWFAAAVNNKEGYSLVGCTVAPGFDFADFEMADRRRLVDLYPKYKDIIEKYT